MSSRLEKLLFTVSMVDKASGPALKLQAQMDALHKKATGGMARIGAGAAGLFSTGYALNSLLAPQREMQRAMGEVRSLGVSEAALKALKNEALDFSVQYGESAADFVKSAYSIQSAIAGLTDNELASFTTASNILAKGTKSDAATITDYMGTMYGIFKTSADSMGKSQWVEQLTGQTALAVKIFKTTGTGMSDAFRATGANAQSAGISMAEQMGVLGQLQGAMPGAEAGTKYKAFLAGVGKAQGELGLKFTDSQGRMLPMVEILEKINGKYSDLSNVAQSDALKKAFGSDEAVSLIKVLIKDTGSLSANINQLGKQTGLEEVRKMAAAMTDPWDKLAMTSTALKMVLGSMIEPILLPMVNALIDLGVAAQGFAERHETLAKIVGGLTLLFLTGIAIISLFSIGVGIASFLSAGWGIAVIMLGGALSALKAIMTVFYITMWLVNGALAGCPITWIVLGIIALIGVVYLLVKYWDDIKQAFLDNSAFKVVLDSLGWIYDKLKAIMGLGSSGIDVSSKIEQQQADTRAAAPSLYGSPGSAQSAVTGPGLMQQYSNINKTSHGTRIENVNITTQKVDERSLRDLQMAG